jgi:hypothetical protein
VGCSDKVLPCPVYSYRFYLTCKDRPGTVEEGEAVQNGALWAYTTIADNNSVETSKITVSVSDLPGNLTEQEFEKQ